MMSLNNFVIYRSGARLSPLVLLPQVSLLYYTLVADEYRTIIGREKSKYAGKAYLRVTSYIP
jgi:hypothetical protein